MNKQLVQVAVEGERPVTLPSGLLAKAEASNFFEAKGRWVKSVRVARVLAETGWTPEGVRFMSAPALAMAVKASGVNKFSDDTRGRRVLVRALESELALV